MRRFGATKPVGSFSLNKDCELATRLQQWYPGYPRGGLKLYDRSGHNRHLTLTNFGSPFTNGDGWYQGVDGRGSSIWFDGFNDYCSGSPGATTYPLTMSCWARYVVLPGIGIDAVLMSLVKTSGLEEFWFGCFNSAGIQFIRSVAQSNSGTNEREFRSNFTVDTTTWHHYCAVFVDSSTQLVYVDGRPMGGSYVTAGAGTPSPAGVDTYYLDSFFYNTSNQYGVANAIIEDACVWDRALSANDVWSLYEPKTRWQLRWQPSAKSHFYNLGGSSPAQVVPPLIQNDQPRRPRRNVIAY